MYSRLVGLGESLIQIAVFLGVLVLIFLAVRQLFLWYWRIDERVELLTEIRDSLKGVRAAKAAKSVQRVSVSDSPAKKAEVSPGAGVGRG